MQKATSQKNSAPNILPEAIGNIIQGEIYIERGLILEKQENSAAHNYLEIINAFPVREFDIFRLLAKGLTAHKIADELCLGYKTVSNYMTQIKKKLHVSSIAELAHIAVIQGVVKH